MSSNNYNSTLFRDDLKAEVSHLGFDLCGITSPGIPKSIGTYMDWVQNNRHAGMGYLASERSLKLRANSELVLPGCRSIMVLGMRYPSPQIFATSTNFPGTGYIAAYARGKDYHDIIPNQMNILVSVIQKMLGHSFNYRMYTDTGPILERDLGCTAGLGWIGKNTSLISKHYGSYFFLAEIFTDIDIISDLINNTDLCGKCHRCIDACPTHCIQPNRTINASHCISYLTIENKGNIPDELRPTISNHCFGCDICQIVCPWNHSRNDINPDYLSMTQWSDPVLMDEIQLDSHSFNQKYLGTPILRSRRRGYLRNVAVAIGNSKDPGVIPVLGNVLAGEPEPLVRSHTAWAFGQIQNPKAKSLLIKYLSIELDSQVQIEIKNALDNNY